MRKMDEAMRKKLILAYAKKATPDELKSVLMDLKTIDTGEYILRDEIVSKADVMPRKEVRKRSLEPFIRIAGLNSKIEEKYYSNFSVNEQGYLFGIMRSIDAFGRIKYGENYQQYCRDFKDLAKVLNVSYNTFKSLIPKIKKYDIVRTVTIEKGHEYANEVFISFNPALALNGVYWDRWTLIVWEDVVRDYKMLTDTQINKILRRNYES